MLEPLELGSRGDVERSHRRALRLGGALARAHSRRQGLVEEGVLEQRLGEIAERLLAPRAKSAACCFIAQRKTSSILAPDRAWSLALESAIRAQRNASSQPGRVPIHYLERAEVPTRAAVDRVGYGYRAGYTLQTAYRTSSVSHGLEEKAVFAIPVFAVPGWEGPQAEGQTRDR